MKTDQTARMHILSSLFPGHTCHQVHFFMLEIRLDYRCYFTWGKKTPFIRCKMIRNVRTGTCVHLNQPAHSKDSPADLCLAHV